MNSFRVWALGACFLFLSGLACAQTDPCTFTKGVSERYDAVITAHNSGKTAAASIAAADFWAHYGRVAGCGAFQPVAEAMKTELTRLGYLAPQAASTNIRTETTGAPTTIESACPLRNCVITITKKKGGLGTGVSREVQQMLER